MNKNKIFGLVVAGVLYSIFLVTWGELSVQNKMEQACRTGNPAIIHGESFTFEGCSVKQILN